MALTQLSFEDSLAQEVLIGVHNIPQGIVNLGGLTQETWIHSTS